MGKPRDGSRKLAKLMAGVGIAAALLSFGTAVYELLHAQGELRERGRIVAEQLAVGREQQAAGYYPAAWDSFEEASATAQVDGLFAKLFGGLGAEREQIRIAQQDLAMEWIRTARATEGQTFEQLADKLASVLATGASASSGPRKADLLAHLGWSYFLRRRSGDGNVRPEVPYGQAVDVDATNPYANVFRGHWILWQRGALSEANERFAAALATDRARGDVRHFQLAALRNLGTDEANAEWLRVVDEMRANGESIDAATARDLYGRYYFALNDSSLMQGMLSVVPAETQLELQHMLLQSNELDAPQKLVMKAITAITLEAAGKKDEALAAWRELHAEIGGERGSNLAERAQREIKRLSRAVRQR